MVVTIILFFLIFGILVISHEFGHFIIGKKCGIRVNEFAVGMGPVLFHFQKGETKYTLRLLPFGGACMFDGEDGSGSDDEDLEKKGDSVKDGDLSDDEHSFPNVNVWKRIATVVAGPAANYIVALVCSFIVVAFSGTDLPNVAKVMPDSAAAEAGLQAGDTIKKINNEHIHMYREVSLDSAMNTQGDPMNIVYERDGKEYKALLTPKYSDEDSRYYIGLVGGGDYMKCNVLQVFEYGFYEVHYWTKYTFKSLKMLVTGKVGVNALSGPVGIAQFVGDTYEEVKPYGLSSVILTMMDILILLSVNLGIMNLLPLPALDGGRLLFMIIEVIRGKKVSPEKEGIVHLAGFIALMVLMVFVMYQDIMRLIK
jgi:regulator of sigma E protease